MVTSVPTRLFILIGMLAVVLSLPSWSAPMKVMVGGYIQPRFTDTFGHPNGGATSTFLALRPSVLIRATDDEHIFAQLFVQGKGNEDTFQIQHAFVDYFDKAYRARLGLSAIPFGYENPVTSSKLITTERSQASNELIGGFALDRGLFGYYLPGKEFNFSLGVINGQPVSVTRDNTETKNFVGRVGYTIPGGEVGVSAYVGKGLPYFALPVGYTFPGVTNPANQTITFDETNRFGFDLQTKQGPFTILAEIISAQQELTVTEIGIEPADTTKSADQVVIFSETATENPIGGYLTVAYRVPDTASEPYVRYDLLQRDIPGLSSDFNRITLGYIHWLSPTAKVQAEYEKIDDDLNAGLDGRATLQYQVVF